ncbi:hypothetical protein [Pseudarthrobacter sp. NamE5]|uniref:hypothetical protein n=1 Tax=Pseudarthrobacter sp. NamE5 TaxID=2576839 RepID=UPI00110AF318|nr:hypothetical protein [Pseudarthrobacter sp. NamE5]TLM83480.1 hypothetical protein FDW84_13705 [Pseudarthrobacter sp. NamE5]
MADFTLRPGNPYDFSTEELEELKLFISSQVPNADFDVVSEAEHGYGVTLYEVIQVIADVRGAGGDLLIGALVMWLQNRWKQERTSGRRPRPRSIVIFDEDGKKLRTIDIDEPDGDPQERRDND